MPWVPQSVLDVLLAATRERVAAVAVPAPLVADTVPTTTAPVVAAQDVLVMPPVVAEACVFYAFDDQDERAANFRRAEALIRAGKSPKEVVQHIKMGAQIEELFI
jgi:hypothetical protein